MLTVVQVEAHHCQHTVNMMQSEPPSQHKLAPSRKGDIITSKAFSPSEF